MYHVLYEISPHSEFQVLLTPGQHWPNTVEIPRTRHLFHAVNYLAIEIVNSM